MSQEDKEDSARQRTLKSELEWIRLSPRARQAKGKARLSAYDALLAEARDRRPGAAEIVIPPGPRLGDKVIVASGLTKGFGEVLLIEGLDFILPPGAIVGVIGPNGAGKTTLFRMITGDETPDGGNLDLGDTVKLGYVDQSRDSLVQSNTVWEEISGGLDEIKLAGTLHTEPGLRVPVQFQGPGPANESGPAFRRRAQPGAPGQDAEVRRQRPCSWTSPPTTWTWKPCGRSSPPCSTSPGAPW